MSILPSALEQNPNLDQWVQFNPDQTLTIRTGKVELGQGIKTAIAMIAAEEMSIDISKVMVETGNTINGPNEFITAGSMSIEESGSAVRQACAEVRSHLMNLAAQLLDLPLTALEIEDGIVRNVSGNESISYWELVGNKPLGIEATGEPSPKNFKSYTLVGSSTRRLDLQNKITGQPAFIQDQLSDTLLHARVVRPQSMAFEIPIFDSSEVENFQGVIKVIKDGNFVGVIAETEEAAVNAQKFLKQSVRWQRKADYKLPDDIYEYLKTNVKTSLPLKEGTPFEGDVPGLLTSERSTNLEATYTKPYLMHASIGPSAAIANLSEDRLLIHSHTQGVHILKGAIAQALGIESGKVDVVHLENAGCYGHNGADDAAMDAALLATHHPGFDILLKWSREDEHLWEPYSPAMRIDLQAGVTGGKISHWNADIYSQSHMGRPFPSASVSNLLAAWQKSDPIKRPEPRPGMQPHGGIHRNADPYYEIKHKRIVKHLAADQTIRTSSTRGLGSFANIFAIETFMDELARVANRDPVQFRLDHLKDERAIRILRTADEAGSKYMAKERPGFSYGRGHAFARYKNTKCYATVSIKLAVNIKTLEIKLLHACIAADAGQIIDRDGLANQLEGGLIQSISWTMKEAVTFDENGPTSKDWKSYPILKFSEVPEIDVILFDQPDLPPLGAGEATQGLGPAAISNAIFNATGVRLRNLPFTSDQLQMSALMDQN